MNLKEYKSLLNNLGRYNTEQEKNAALYCLDDEKTPLELAKLLGSNPTNLFEAIAFVFKLRENSVSDLIELTHSCKECNHMNLQVISIPDMFFKDEDNIDESVPVGLFTTTEDLDNVEFADGADINNLSISEFNLIEEKILSNNLKIFDPGVSLTCKKCQTVLPTTVIYSDIVSKFSISNLYEQYLDISQFSSMTKKDTDNMFPFEREIFLSLIQHREDEKSK